MRKHLEFLQKSAVLEKLSHAYLFSGNDEETKQSTLSGIIQFLVCSAAKKPCQKCAGCLAMKAQRHPDVTFISPLEDSKSQEITVAQMRDLIAKLSLGVWQGEYKIAVIQKAHAMNQEAQSALLKLLEEPKGNVIFFLISEHASLLFPTIRSRAQELKFYAFSSQKTSELTAKETVKDFISLQRKTLADRFAYAKSVSESPEKIPGLLEDWIGFMRNRLVEELQKKDVPQERIRHMKNIIVQTQEIATLLSTTNVQPRLAIEQIFISF